jgi:hypothetical protein
MTDMRNTYRILHGKPERRDDLSDLTLKHML